ncbi:MAG: non-ribosomal peptide synthetase, partial [bacterium]|nr:non-ribosomal peptide synthetase [bacterium]
DYPARDNRVKNTASVSFSLNRRQTETLLTRVNRAFNTEINDILLTALGLSIEEKFGHSRVWVALEGHGREEIPAKLDISRTVGWFTSVYPVLLDLSAHPVQGQEEQLAYRIKKIKETLRQVPNRGIGYGILKYITDRQHKPGNLTLTPQVSFNYLGQFDADLEHTSFGIARESAGQALSPENTRDYELDITGMILDNRLVMSIGYNKKQYKKGTLEVLLKIYKQQLLRLVSYCSAVSKTQPTPCDFTYPGLTIPQVDNISRQYDVEDIYTLSPMQEGMLFHSLLDNRSHAYFEQISYHLQGQLDPVLVEKSLNRLIQRY